MQPLDQPFADGDVALLYDAFPFDADVPFYLGLAQRAGGRVLEVGCGTGRLLLHLAAAGHRVVGVDASPHMLAIARRKLAEANGSLADGGPVSLVEADMRALGTLGQFDLAIVAVRSFGYLLTPADQVAALECIASQLRAGGLLALDLLHPLPAWLLEPPGSVRQDLCERLPDGRLVTRTETVVSTDLAAQVRWTRSAYEIARPDGHLTKQTVEWSNRFTYRFEAEHLLERSGFVVEAVHGGYDGEPFTGESRTMVVVARRQAGA